MERSGGSQVAQRRLLSMYIFLFCFFPSGFSTLKHLAVFFSIPFPSSMNKDKQIPVNAIPNVDSVSSSIGVTGTHVAVGPYSPVSKEALVLSDGYFCAKQPALSPTCPSQTIVLPFNLLNLDISFHQLN